MDALMPFIKDEPFSLRARRSTSYPFILYDTLKKITNKK